MSDVTAIYYTSNREQSSLESNIRAALKAQCEQHAVPLVSVSQQTLPGFGTNLCVGDVGASGHNGFRQMQIAATEAKTRFVCTAESDFLYPDEYFRFVPLRDDTLYMFVPVWILYSRAGDARCFYRKRAGSEGAMIASRSLIIDRCKQVLANRPQWDARDIDKRDQFLNKQKTVYVNSSVPLLTIKTEQQLHRRSPIILESKTRFLEPFGWASDVIERNHNA